jgi:hypothetical protein
MATSEDRASKIRELAALAETREKEKQAEVEPKGEREQMEGELTKAKNELSKMKSELPGLEALVAKVPLNAEELGLINEELKNYRTDIENKKQEIAELNNRKAQLDTESGIPLGKPEAVPAEPPVSEMSVELPAISPRAQELIDKMVDNIGRSPDTFDHDADPGHTLVMLRSGDRKVFAGVLEHFKVALDKKRKEKGDSSLDSYDFQQSVALSNMMAEAHSLQSQGVEVRQEMIDDAASSFLRTVNADLKNADVEKITQMLSERQTLVQEIQKELNARLIAGEQLPSDLEKDYAEFLQILEKNDAEAERYTKETEALPHKEQMKRGVKRSFLKGYEFDDSGMYDVMQYRFKGKQSEKPDGRQSYVDRAYDAYASITGKYGIETPTKPKPPEEVFRRRGFGKKKSSEPAPDENVITL